MNTGPLFEKIFHCKKKIIVCQGGGDAGKCLGIGTPVLMYDLSKKIVQDIMPGDLLMGIDGTPRKVRSTVKGRGQLYNVKQTRGIDYIVNDAHILCLKNSEGKELYKTIKGKKIYQGHSKVSGIHKITAKELFESSGRYKRQYRGFKTGFELPVRDVLIDPYYLGLWLGDGISRNSNICNVDQEVREYLVEVGEKNGCVVIQDPNDKNTMRLSRPLNTKYRDGSINLLYHNLKKYNLLNNKHIPFDYLHNCRESRNLLLAGLIDSDGTLSKKGYYSISTTKEPLANQIMTLVASLGYYCSLTTKVAKMKRKDGSVYQCNCWQISISCNNGNSIPTLIPRKQKIFKNKVCDCLNSTLKIEKLDIGDYYGFTLDGDRMFMLGDFTVTHNTVTILQAIAIKAIQYNRSVITVTGQDTPNLKGGALRAFQKYVESDEEIKSHIREYNKTDRIYTFKNGSVIEFKSFDNEEDARGSERDFLFINEATNLSYNLFWQLQRKTRHQVYLDYNPTSVFWCHEKLLKENPEYHGKVQLYITDHRHNPFLSHEDHDAYENIGDADLFKVYSRGLTGKIRGLIFGHFKPIEAIPSDCDKIIWGIDYGYTNDETALVKVGVKGRKRFIKELCYEPGIPPDRLKELLIGCGYNKEPIYSEHDPNIIAQLRRLGLPVFPARKGPGSITAGIARVREFECFYTTDSLNLKKEIENYKWVVAQDLTTGKEVMTNIPVDGHDHACQALTYAIYSDSFRQVS